MARNREARISPPIVLAADMALFLDVDGTLLDIAPTPDAVRVPADLGAILGQIARRLGGALAIVSGRSIATLDRLFPNLVTAMAGQHGAELRLPLGVVERLGAVEPLPEPLLAGLAALARRWPEILVEPKGVTVALHYRSVPELERELEIALERLVAPHREDVGLKRGKFVLEIAPRQVDKGKAVERLMTLPPFAGRRPVFIGDDVTDEDGFAAVLRLGGRAIRVGAVGDERYDGRFENPAALRDWLGATAASTPGGGAGGGS